jgi:sugar O-acyltransferase (sialic acid O-acetyltransferase NeuD family)
VIRKSIVIAGAGGVARELRWLIEEINQEAQWLDPLGFVVSDLESLRDTDSRDLVRGDFDWLDQHRAEIDCVAVGIGSPAARQRVATAIRELLPDADFPALVHPSARFDRSSSTIGEGVAIGAGTLGTVNLELGPFALVGVGVTLGHEARIGAWSALNPRSTVSGGVRLGERVLIGSQALVLQYLSVGDDAVVGAGAVVTKNVPPATTVAGVPARPLAG